MRITERRIQQNVVDDVNRHLANMDRLQKQISTGRRIHSLSEDPAGAARSLALGSAQEALTQYRKNTEESVAWMDATLAALARARETLQEARQQGLEGGTDTTPAEARRALAVSVGRLRERLLEAANTTWNGASLFGGHRTTVPAFNDAAAYQGDDGLLTRDIASGESTVVNVTGRRAFIGGTNLFAALDTLQTALAADDGPAIRDALAPLNDGMNQLLTLEAELGAETQRVQATQARLDDLEVTLTRRRSENDDTDMTRALVDLQNADRLYQSALAASSQLFKTSLLDFLR